MSPKQHAPTRDVARKNAKSNLHSKSDLSITLGALARMARPFVISAALPWPMTKPKTKPKKPKKHKPDPEFPNRLNHLCDSAAVPADRGRVTAVANIFAVARETPRLWFLGKVMPEIPRLIEIVDTFGTTLDWLVLGRGEVSAPYKGLKNQRVGEEKAVYETLSAQERAVIAAMRELSEKRRAGLLALLTER
ncbi:hypothetical protein [Dyella tabacisoli]|uniref:hypothetical protein n=1 Tax=Dyella tabacisoli TaxID=2282381 RepID=UPI001CDC0C74|nr:hypothetical protein [Dyella tabacisoli]